MKAIPEEPARGSQSLLVQGDNLELLRSLPPAIADLVVTDPPFHTGRRHVPPRARGAVVVQTTDGVGQGGFNDCWDDIEHYLDFLRPRLEEMHRILKPDGSMVVHLDHRAVHEVKLEMDRIFGRRHFINEIIWHYTGGGRSKRYFSRKHDILLWYARGGRWTFNIDEIRVPYKPSSGYARGGIVGRSGKRYRPHPAGTPVDDVWDIPMINPLSRERCGFPTQKPERLLERIILAMSCEGDLVIDPFCGSGTAAVVAERFGRRWIACDCSAQAVAITARRIKEAGRSASADAAFETLRLEGALPIERSARQRPAT